MGLLISKEINIDEYIDCDVEIEVSDIIKDLSDFEEHELIKLINAIQNELNLRFSSPTNENSLLFSDFKKVISDFSQRVFTGRTNVFNAIEMLQKQIDNG